MRQQDTIVSMMAEPAPVAAFSGTPVSGTAPIAVTFTDLSTGSPTSWSWEKNDGLGWVPFSGTPTAQNPVENFATGTWSVRLTVSNVWGSTSETKTNYVQAAVAPVANFTGTPLSGASPLSVTFTDTSTNTPTSWSWEKNNGGGWVPFAGTPNAQNPTESFATGTWSVRLTVTNVAGSDDETKSNYVSAAVAPVAAFSGTPLSGVAPLTVAFTDASTNTPTSWLWEKNDGSGWVSFDGTPTTQNPSEDFDSGIWDVRLTATNVGGSDDETKTDYVDATADPFAHRYWQIVNLTVEDTVAFEITELQLLSGGTNVNSLATKTSSSAPSSGTLANLFDGTFATPVSWAKSTITAGGFYIRWDFGGGGDINIDGVKQASYNDFDRHMRGFELQYSDDGTTWTTKGTKNSIPWAGVNTLSAEYQFPEPTVGGHRYWRFTGLDVTTYLEIAELKIFEDAVDVTLGAYITASSTPDINGFPYHLVDGDSTTRPIWSAAVAEAGGFYIQFDMGTNASYDINGVKQMGYDTAGRHMQAFTLSYSDDGSSFTTLGSKSGLAYPGNATFSALYTFP